ncbi:MAG: sulfite exporter TauE/SafE family protein [Candidatus Ancillula sp.]|nr:sulfite exporter TauE/SafE family protein [Candidatus Ancillula sp.]
MKHKLSILGMHCRACEKLIQDELLEVAGVQNPIAQLKTQSVTFEVVGEFSQFEVEQAILRAGYKIGVENRPVVSHNPQDWAVVMIGVAVVLLGLAIMHVFNITPQVLKPSALFGSSYGDMTAQEFSISQMLFPVLSGLTAGFSTCMALIGALVVGISARHEQRYPNATRLQNFDPHLYFNFGRIAGFGVFGFILGLLGSALTFNSTVLGLLTALAGLFMLLVGLQLTRLFPRLTTLSMPPKIAQKFGINKRRNGQYSHLSSVVLGALTFFLPCGFTQAMQLQAISTASPLWGALTMLLFAVGTTPGLLSAGALTALLRGKVGKQIFKIIGVVVVAMSLSSISTGMQFVNFQKIFAINLAENISTEDVEVVNLNFLHDDQFDKDNITLHTGKRYKLRIMPQENGYGCMSTVMIQGLSDNSPELLKKDKQLEFYLQPEKVGVYNIVCAMGIKFNTKIFVVN